MTAKTIRIDRNRCNGCGLCVSACHEGAIGIVDGKADIVRPNLCDGLGSCLPACPQGAISFGEDDAVSMPDLMARPAFQWPIQIGLVSPLMNCFKGTLVIAADCTAFAFDGDFKKRFVSGKPLIIGCPKLDDGARFTKILDILKGNDIDCVEIVRMEVPCCSALTGMVKRAVEESGGSMAISETVITKRGRIAGV